MGYLNNTNRQTGENTLVKDPERFPLIRRMWELMLTGLYTPPRIREIANNEWGFRTRPTRKMGGKPLCHSAIYQLFTKPFYYGWFEHPSGSGQWHQGRHEPHITKAEYLKEELRELWNQPSRQKMAAFLKDWRQKADQTAIGQLMKMAKTLRTHASGILTYARHPITSGKLEGINNKIKTLTKRSYGFHDENFFILKLLSLHHSKYKLVG